MFSVTKNPLGKFEIRNGFYRPGKLIAVSAILLSASAGMSFAGNYPVSTGDVQSESIARACTQLELSADMTKAECGTLTLDEVVSRLDVFDRDDRDD